MLENIARWTRRIPGCSVEQMVDRLDEPFRTISNFNPVVHMVVGLRAGMLGLPQPRTAGMTILLVLAISATGLAYRLLKSGYKLKA